MSDDDRAAYNDILRTAYAEGRITDVELEERLTAVLEARFEADLLPVVSDLPTGSLPAPLPPPTPGTDGELAAMRSEGGSWWVGPFLVPPIICTAIYAMTNFGGYFWPMWVWLGCMIPVLFGFFGRD